MAIFDVKKAHQLFWTLLCHGPFLTLLCCSFFINDVFWPFFRPLKWRKPTRNSLFWRSKYVRKRKCFFCVFWHFRNVHKKANFEWVFTFLALFATPKCPEAPRIDQKPALYGSSVGIMALFGTFDTFGYPRSRFAWTKRSGKWSDFLTTQRKEFWRPWWRLPKKDPNLAGPGQASGGLLLLFLIDCELDVWRESHTKTKIRKKAKLSKEEKPLRNEKNSLLFPCFS